MGRYEKKPTNKINWADKAVDLIVGLISGLILIVLDRIIK